MVELSLDIPQETKIRTLVSNGIPYLCLLDVCDALNLIEEDIIDDFLNNYYDAEGKGIGDLFRHSLDGGVYEFVTIPQVYFVMSRAKRKYVKALSKYLESQGVGVLRGLL